MDKQVLNKGYTFVEMIFVVMILMIVTGLSIHHLADYSVYKFQMVYELLLNTQMDSLENKEIHEIEINDHTLKIDDTKYSIAPLSCEHVSFRYNRQGNVSHADTIHCFSQYKEFIMPLQLGTGWLSYEK